MPQALLELGHGSVLSTSFGSGLEGAALGSPALGFITLDLAGYAAGFISCRTGAVVACTPHFQLRISGKS